MSKHKRKQQASIDPNSLVTRDYAMLALIGGATKAAVHVDRRKQANKRLARRKVDRNDW